MPSTWQGVRDSDHPKHVDHMYDAMLASDEPRPKHKPKRVFEHVRVMVDGRPELVHHTKVREVMDAQPINDLPLMEPEPQAWWGSRCVDTSSKK